MYYLLTSVTCVISILYYAQAANARIKFRSDPSKTDIDEIITKVLASDKFNELAEKIAEKAVERIKDIDHRFDSSQQKVHFKNNEQSSEKEQADSESDLNNEPTKDKGENSNKLTTLNTEEFIKRDALKPLERLTLKFKYFTKAVSVKNEESNEKRKHSAENRKAPIKKQEKALNKKTTSKDKYASSDEDKETTTTEKNDEVEKEEKVYFKAMDSDISSEHNQLRQNAEHDKKEKSKPTKDEHRSLEKDTKIKPIDAVETDSEHDESNQEKPQHKQVLRTIALEKEKHDSKEVTKKKKSDKKEGETFKTKPAKLTTFTISLQEPMYNETKVTDVSYDESDTNKVSSDNNKYVLSKESKREFGSIVDMKIRREGKKFYTFENSPDYQEYHEELEKYRKMKN